MNVYDKAQEFAKELKETPEVVEYREAFKKIENDAGSKKMIEDFRRKQMELVSMQMQGVQLTQEQIESFNSLAAVISLNPDVKNYLESEFNFSRMWEGIMKILGDAIGIDFTRGSQG